MKAHGKLTYAKRKKYLDRYRAKHPEKVRARSAVGVALRKGVITKATCFCGVQEVEAHHDDYRKALEVTWLCREHHRIITNI